MPGVIHEEKGFFSTTIYPKLQSKTILYCLHEMNKSIPESVVKTITNLDVDKFLANWLKKLDQVNKDYHDLLKDLLVEQAKKGSFFRIAISQEFLRNLYMKFHFMKELLITQTGLTPFDILNTLEPYVGKIYKNAFTQETTFFKRFMNVTESLYKKDKDGHQLSAINSIQMYEIMDIPKAELVESDFLCKLSPASSLDYILRCMEQRLKAETYLQQILKGEVDIQKINASNLSEREEKKLLEESLRKDSYVLAYHNSSLVLGRAFSTIFPHF